MLSIVRGLMLLLALPTALARAEPLGDPTEAQRLFDEARAELEAKRYAEACPKLERSQQLDPQLGTSLHLAHCYEKADRLEDAWNQFQDALLVASQRRQQGQPDERETLAQRRMAALEPRVALVTFALAEPAPAGLSIEHDGQSLAGEPWGRALAVAPGSHRLLVRAPGRRQWEHEYALGKLQRLRIELPPLAAEAGAAPPVAQLAPSAATPRPAAAPPRDSDDGPGPQRMAAYVLGGAGIISLGIATGFYLTASSASNEQDPIWSACQRSTPDCNAQRNNDLEQTIQTNAERARIALAVGGALVVGAVVLFLTAPERETRPAVALSVGPGTALVWVNGPEF